jgi:1,4-alpha-glucan branching enzyme
LLDHPGLKYRRLAAFDRAMLHLFKDGNVLADPWPRLVLQHNDDKLLAAWRGGMLFVFSFHPHRSFVDYPLACEPGKYRLIFDSDAAGFGGHGRLTPDQVHFTLPESLGAGALRHRLSLYIPNRTVQVLRPEA